MGSKVTGKGAVSALCSEPPRAIDLRRSGWTIRAAAVTCERCRQMLQARARPVIG